MTPVTVHCFAYAGGNAFSYRSLDNVCPAGLRPAGIELPGRGRRSGEPLLLDLEALADDAFSQLTGGISAAPYVLFGHSMGATLAYLCLHRIARAGLPLPLALVVSGRAAPGTDEKRYRHQLPRAQFVAMLRELGGCPPEILDDADLIDYFEPILRADFQAVETWQAQPLGPLAVPIVVLRGRADAVSAEQCAAWARHSSATTTVHEFDGGHFFIQQHWASIAALLGEAAGWQKAGEHSWY